ncbi:MAG TPA: CcmD family protein [Spirochaetota bacterium]|nr:CcmD family protein [Spirochaetota bacterium]HPR37902.1 CcmD family protein [Spirochaetota bacterium]HRX47829.1 CcmD family protein [Spirochaetota bacterium]
MTSNPLITLMAVVIIIWFGLALFLYRLDRKISKIEGEIHEP